LRILAISDCHADARLFGAPRFAEVEAAMLESVRVAIERRVDAWLFLGDLCDPDSGVSVFRCLRLAAECVRRLNVHQIRSIWLSGNHDSIDDSSGETTLEPLKPLGPHLVFDRPEWTAIGPTGTDPHDGTLPCLALPFVPACRDYDPLEYATSTWDKATLGCRDVLVLTHLSIRGAALGEESYEMARGRSVEYPREQIEKLAAERNQRVHQYAGHFHIRQRIGGVQVVGAPARFAYGEARAEPAFLIAEVG
jgi:hypothetical protein